MELSIEELQVLADRCRLRLHEDELEKYRRDIAALETLSAALLPYDGETEDCDRSDGLDDLRPDVAVGAYVREALLPETSVREGAYLSVPRAVEGVS